MQSSTTVGRGSARLCVQHNSSNDGPNTLRCSATRDSIFLARLGREEVSPFSSLGEAPLCPRRRLTDYLNRNLWLNSKEGRMAMEEPWWLVGCIGEDCLIEETVWRDDRERKMEMTWIEAHIFIYSMMLSLGLLPYQCILACLAAPLTIVIEEISLVNE